MKTLGCPGCWKEDAISIRSSNLITSDTVPHRPFPRAQTPELLQLCQGWSPPVVTPIDTGGIVFGV